MGTTVTISLSEYNGYQKLKEGLKKRIIIEGRSFLGTTYYYIPENTCANILLDKIKELEEDKRKLQEENKKHLDAQYEVLKENVKQEHKAKPWWKICG